jgi:hypothetical protein
MIVRAHFRPHFRGPLTATPRPPVSLSLTSFPRFFKSHRITSFADPHPLTLLESYRFKNRGGGRVPGPSHVPHPVSPSSKSITVLSRACLPQAGAARDLLSLASFLLCVLSFLRYLFLFPPVFTSLLLPVVTSIFRKAKSCPQNNTLSISANTRTPAATAAIC